MSFYSVSLNVETLSLFRTVSEIQWVIGRRSQNFHPHPVRILERWFSSEKTRTVELAACNFHDMFSIFVTTPACDRRTTDNLVIINRYIFIARW